MNLKSEKRSEEKMREFAAQQGVGQQFGEIVEKLSGWSDEVKYLVQSVGYYCDLHEGGKLGRSCLISIYLDTSSAAKGLHMQVMVDRVARYLKLDREDVLASLTVAGTLKTFSNKDAGEGYEFYLHTSDNIDALIRLLSAKQSNPAT